MAAMNVASKNGFYPQKRHDSKSAFFLFSTPPDGRQIRLGGALKEGGVQNGPPPLALADAAARNYYNIWRLAEL
jgi:hypothetical protein